MEDTLLALDRVTYIHYPLRFHKDKENKVKALINSSNEVNAMTSTYVAKLGLKIRHTNVEALKIDGSTLKTFEMVLASFQVEDKQGQTRFFQETFILADISAEMVLKMLFLTFSNVEVSFLEQKLIWKSYTTAKALPTTKRVELIDKKEFVKAALDENFETFVVHVAALEALLSGLSIHLDKAAQITFLLTEKVTIPDKYSDFADVFSKEKAMVLPDRIDLNEHAIKLEGDKQPLYEPIYSLGPVELETLKAYIETHLKTGFIWLFKSQAGGLILFDKKLDGSLRLCINYQELNNLTIKN